MTFEFLPAHHRDLLGDTAVLQYPVCDVTLSSDIFPDLQMFRRRHIAAVGQDAIHQFVSQCMQRQGGKYMMSFTSLAGILVDEAAVSRSAVAAVYFHQGRRF